MNIPNLIPIARLNDTVRKRLFGILAGEFTINVSHSRERVQEAGRYCSNGLARPYNSLIENRGNESPRMTLSLLNKKPKVEKAAVLEVMENQICIPSSDDVHLVQDESRLALDQCTPSCDQYQGVQANKPKSTRKKRKPRLFRRFMRILACNPKEATGRDRVRQVCDSETVVPNKCPATFTEQVAFTQDKSSLDSIVGEETVNQKAMNTTDSHQEVLMGDITYEICNHESKREEVVVQYNSKAHLSPVRSIESDGSSCEALAPQNTGEYCDLEMQPDEAKQIAGKHHVPSNSLMDQDDWNSGVYFRKPETNDFKDDGSDNSLHLNSLFDQTSDNVLDGKPKAVNKGTKSKRRVVKKKVKNAADKDNDGTHKTEVKVKKRTGSISNALPNYFLALKVDNPVIHSKVKELQEHIINETVLYRNVMIPVATLHMTLLVMRLDNQSDIDDAKDALQESKDTLQSIFRNCSNKELTFHGVENFRNKVVYLGLEKTSQQEIFACLQKTVSALRSHYFTKGIESTGNGKETFIPHVTVMKMSKNIKKMKKNGIKHIDQKLYKDFLAYDFGTQEFSEVLLCSMLDKKDNSGFYNVIDRIEISICD